MESSILRNIMQCSPLIQSTFQKNVSPQSSGFCLLYAGFLLHLLLYPKDAGEMLFRHVVDFQLTTRRYVPNKMILCYGEYQLIYQWINYKSDLKKMVQLLKRNVVLRHSCFNFSVFASQQSGLTSRVTGHGGVAPWFLKIVTLWKRVVSPGSHPTLRRSSWKMAKL
jgi:hypothetical protein